MELADHNECQECMEHENNFSLADSQKRGYMFHDLKIEHMIQDSENERMALGLETGYAHRVHT